MSPPPSDNFRLLLDQGFPKPTSYAISELDHTVTVMHLSDFDDALSQVSTPDWYVYCAAAEGGFDALVVRDRSQLEQLEEMYILSLLPDLTVITWRKGLDDPVREWGQLLAYLPLIKQRCREKGGRVILLPAPSLGSQSFYRPRDTLGTTAKRQGVSHQQVQSDTKQRVVDWLDMMSESPDRFDSLLGW